MARASILVIEDDIEVARFLTTALETSAYHVRVASTATQGIALLEQAHPDLIILDLMLPDEDGLVLCSTLKSIADVPILVCSGTHRRRDGFLSLKLGADDFVAKPFDLYDFLARVEALLRRAAAQPHALESTGPQQPIRLGPLVIDDSPHQVTLGGRPVQLTPTEYRLLGVLASRPGQVVPRETLAQLVWGNPDTEHSRTIDVHIGRLRVKLAQGPVPAPPIVSVRGFGYKLIVPESSSASAAPQASPRDTPTAG